MLADPCPPCLMWLPLLHRMASVEHVYHPVVCDACQVKSFVYIKELSYCLKNSKS